MSNVIDTIEFGFGYPVDSRIAIVQNYNQDARDGKYAGNYGNMLRSILDIDCQELENEEHARIQVGYVLDGAVRANIEGVKIDPTALYVEATARTRDFIKDVGWVFAKKDAEVKLDESGRPRPKKGSKGERSYEVYCELVAKNATRKEIIKAFQSEKIMGMTPHTKSGATTYFYNMKKKYDNEHS